MNQNNFLGVIYVWFVQEKTQKPTEKLHSEQSKVTNPEPEITLDEIVALVIVLIHSDNFSSQYKNTPGAS
jgi:hypothetical protein